MDIATRQLADVRIRAWCTNVEVLDCRLCIPLNFPCLHDVPPPKGSVTNLLENQVDRDTHRTNGRLPPSVIADVAQTHLPTGVDAQAVDTLEVSIVQKVYLATVDAALTCEHLGKFRLSIPSNTRDTQNLTLGDCQVDVVETMTRRRGFERHIVQLQDRRSN